MTSKKIIATLIILSFVLLVASVVFYIDKTRDQRKLDPVDLETMTKEQVLQTIYERQSSEGTPFYLFIPIFGYVS